MTGWYYYENDGQKRGPYSHVQLTQIVMQGMITRETFVEDQNGRICAAEEVEGLGFPKMIRPHESHSLTETVPEFDQTIPQCIPIPIAAKNMTLLWKILVGVLLFLIVAVAGLLIMRLIEKKKLIGKLNTVTENQLVSNVVKDLPLAITRVDFNWQFQSSRNALGSFAVTMKTAERLYEPVDNQFALRKLVITDPFDWELNDARKKNNALPVSSRITEERLDWPQFYDILVPKDGEITLTGNVVLTKDDRGDWHVENMSADPFSTMNKTFDGHQWIPESRLTATECRLDDQNSKTMTNEIIQNRRNFVRDVSLVRVQTPNRPMIDYP